MGVKNVSKQLFQMLMTEEAPQREHALCQVLSMFIRVSQRV
jgi:hypothetical protein